MFYQEDYLIRAINNMIKAVFLMIFGAQSCSNLADEIREDNARELLLHLLVMIEVGKINEAENLLFMAVENKTDDNLKLGLTFYYYLNKRSDEFLKEHGFSRAEIEEGLGELMAFYEKENIMDLVTGEKMDV